MELADLGSTSSQYFLIILIYLISSEIELWDASEKWELSIREK